MRAVCERQAIVWDAIERLAFQPRTDKERNRWLSEYGRSLFKLWGLQPTDIPIRRNQGFDALFLNIACDYAIETFDRYSVTIANAATNTPACWYMHVDPDYRSRSDFFKSSEDYPTQDMNTHLEHEVKTALDGMIFHPRNHAHADKLGIASALGGESELSSYEIRLGGGIENGFVFLTHLRYQLCLVSTDTRQNERTRLIRLFTDAIRDRRHEKGHPIPAGKLFPLKT